MNRAALVLAVAALVPLAVGASGAADASPAALIDRSVSCPLTTSDGLRLLSVGGSPGYVGFPGTSSISVLDTLRNSSSGGLVWAGDGYIRLSLGCSAARRIPLSRAGLPGPPGIFAADWDCPMKPTTVRLRIRATVARATPWRREREQLVLQRAVSKAEVTVQTPSGKPIAFMALAKNTFRIWVAPTCVR